MRSSFFLALGAALSVMGCSRTQTGAAGDPCRTDGDCAEALACQFATCAVIGGGGGGGGGGADGGDGGDGAGATLCNTANNGCVLADDGFCDEPDAFAGGGPDDESAGCDAGTDGADCGRCIVSGTTCADSPCVNDGTCADVADSFVCSCPPGVTGPRCGEDVNECADAPCGEHGVCENTLGSFFCACAEGYTGDDCNEDVDECAFGVCAYGTCTNQPGTFACACDQGFEGPNCETPIGWSCEAHEASDFECDCGCGVPDPQCFSADRGACAAFNCVTFLDDNSSCRPRGTCPVDQVCTDYRVGETERIELCITSGFEVPADAAECGPSSCPAGFGCFSVGQELFRCLRFCTP